MSRPPRRPDESLLSRFIVWRIGLVTSVAVAGTFGLYLWEIERGAELDAARTVAVNTIVAFEVFYLFNARFLVASSATPVAFRATRFIWIAVAAIVVLQALFTHAPPMQALFGTTDIDAATWVRLACVAASVVHFSHFLRVQTKRLFAHHVLSSLCSRQRDVAVRIIGRGDDDGVHVIARTGFLEVGGVVLGLPLVLAPG